MKRREIPWATDLVVAIKAIVLLILTTLIILGAFGVIEVIGIHP